MVREEDRAVAPPPRGDVSAFAELLRRRRDSFDPDDDTAADAIRFGVAPLVHAYVRCCRVDAELSPVERSLLEGTLNDWLRAYAESRGLPAFDGTAFSIHEIAMEYADCRDVAAAVSRLFRASDAATAPDAGGDGPSSGGRDGVASGGRPAGDSRDAGRRR
ncbi:hypothetical protein [Halobaculum sp. D14]|uniref:hypothetical protein n=1 Tax=Halobaculum sp. D14 TaxID=3421642 RepID=UPI003EBE694A